MKRKSRKQIEQEYDDLYDKVDALISRTNPCDITTKGKTTFCGSCSHRVCGDIIYPNELCCDGCPHHSMTKGCQAEKPLQCKLWLCSMSKTKHPVVARKLREFQDEANELFGYGCLLNRGDKKDTINHIIEMNRYYEGYA